MPDELPSFDSSWVERTWPGLPKRDPGESLILLDSVDSTNRLARAIAGAYLGEGEQAPPSVDVLAAAQSAGRGRHGRSWSSPQGGGVYATHLAPLPPGEDYAHLPLTVGVALATELNRYCEEPCRIKWPNDLVVARRKLGGILIEVLRRGEFGAALIGFGVNFRLSSKSMPAEAISLAEVSSSPPRLGVLAGSLLASLRRHLALPWDSVELVSEYRRLSLHRRGDALRVRGPQGALAGTFRGFSEAGRLRLEVGGDVQEISVGEV